MNAQPLQRTDAWFAARIGKVTASRVGAILGLSKYRTPVDVMRAMVREALGAESEFTGNEATRYGTEHEADAIAAYEAETGSFVTLAPSIVHPEHDWLAASPDGLLDDGGGIEAKCPMRARYTEASAEYQAQMQLQMACAGLAWVDFVIWRDGEPLIIKRYARDPAWLTDNLPALQEFTDRYRRIIAEPELAAPYLADIERDDTAWRQATNCLRLAAKHKQDADDAYKAALDDLQALAPAGAKGCGVTLSRVERAGAIAYAKALKALAPDADLEPYRGAPSTYYKATITNEEAA